MILSKICNEFKLSVLRLEAAGIDQVSKCTNYGDEDKGSSRKPCILYKVKIYFTFRTILHSGHRISNLALMRIGPVVCKVGHLTPWAF